MTAQRAGMLRRGTVSALDAALFKRLSTAEQFVIVHPQTARIESALPWKQQSRSWTQTLVVDPGSRPVPAPRLQSRVSHRTVPPAANADCRISALLLDRPCGLSVARSLSCLRTPTALDFADGVSLIERCPVWPRSTGVESCISNAFSPSRALRHPYVSSSVRGGHPAPSASCLAGCGPLTTMPHWRRRMGSP